MATEKTYFPVKAACLRGILRKRALCICGLSDIFTVREFLAVKSGITLAAGKLGLQKEQNLAGWSGLAMGTNQAAVLGQKLGLPAPGAVALSGTISPTSCKEVSPAPCGIQLGGSLLLSSHRYRTIGDLEGLTIGDIQDWTLETFYYVEV